MTEIFNEHLLACKNTTLPSLKRLPCLFPPLPFLESLTKVTVDNRPEVGLCNHYSQHQDQKLQVHNGQGTVRNLAWGVIPRGDLGGESLKYISQELPWWCRA